MRNLGQDQAAAVVGCTPRQLGYRDKEKTGPPRSEDGGYPPRALGEWYKRELLAGLGVDPDGRVYDYEAERARLTKEKADQAAMETRRLNGELLPAEEVLRLMQADYAAVRARLLSIPTKLAPQVIGLKRLPLIEEQLRAAISEALAELASNGEGNEHSSTDKPRRGRKVRARATARAPRAHPAAAANP